MGKRKKIQQLPCPEPRFGMGNAEVACKDEQILLDTQIRVKGIVLLADPDPGFDRMRMVVVLPATLGPRRPKNSPVATAKDKPSTAVKPS